MIESPSPQEENIIKDVRNFFRLEKLKKNKTIDTTIKGIPPGKYMPVEHLWNIPVRYSQHVGKIFPMKFWGIF